MKWMRRFAPRWHVTAAIVTACVAGNTLAAQNQDEPEPNPPRVRAASPQSPKSDATNGDANPNYSQAATASPRDPTLVSKWESALRSAQGPLPLRCVC